MAEEFDRESVLKALRDINFPTDDEFLNSPLSALDSILELNDDSFEVIKEIVLSELESTYNSPEFRISVLETLRDSGVFADDLINDLEDSIDVINEMDDLSESKKDFLKRVLLLIVNSVESCNSSLRRIIQIPFEICRDGAQQPTYAHVTDAAMDVYAPEEITLAPGERKIIPTGIKVAIPRGYALLVQPRSGLSAKTNLRVANSPGLIDSDYRDEIGVILENTEPRIKDIDFDFGEDGEITIKSIEFGKPYIISEGDRFAQLRLVEAPTANLVQVKNISEFGDDRNGGFGSTGA